MASPETSSHELPLHAQLYRLNISSTELLVLLAILQHNSSGTFNYAALKRIAAYAKLSRRTVQAAIHGTPPHRRKDGSIRKGRPGLADDSRRILVAMAPHNSAERRPTTYRIQIEAAPPCPRVAAYIQRDEQRRLRREPTLPFPSEDKIAAWRQENRNTWARLERTLDQQTRSSAFLRLNEPDRQRQGIAIARNLGVPLDVAQLLFLNKRRT